MKMNQHAIEFYTIVDELLALPDVQKMAEFTQHCNTSRLEHSLNVAYISFLWCKKLKLDFRSAARAGMLHDLFLYDWRCDKQPEGAHAFAHPKVALRNAKNIAQLSPMEEDAIVNHMWPVTFSLPQYKESFIVSFADKYSTCGEVFRIFGKACKQKLSFAKNI